MKNKEKTNKKEHICACGSGKKFKNCCGSGSYC